MASNYADLRHHTFKNVRRHKAFLVDTTAVMAFSTYSDSFLKDCAICEFLKPLVTIWNN